MFKQSTRVLVIDDMIAMRALVGKSLREIGFTDITEASDGMKGWELIKSASPPIGLVVSDWNMPNLTGLELLRRVRSDSQFSRLPFVMLTSEAESHQILEALAEGVSSYVFKPIDAVKFRATLEEIHSKITEGDR